ncbi:tetratricopeptide repeat-containing sensor histidine kinase [Chryseolinea lacunae]|uniref:histidine kinase n=1 Tax=Chryseolinea lacunae TaxID=2801331 RepID=A0ABS1KQ11_9BACT|nr:tetratricopeptide repeat protein [Chryseolinea lacunae]MBL0741454.1 tetratricopeptide repeat protein [Chryseolinea lacunae]
MKPFLWLIVVVNLPFAGMGQSKTDSLKTLLKIARNQNNKTETAFYLSHIGWQFLEKGKLDSSLYYYSQSLATKSSKSEVAASALECIGVIYGSKNYPDSSIKYYNKAIGLYTELGDTTRGIVIQNNLAIIYRDLGLYEKALEIAFEGLATLEHKNPDRLLASFYNTVASIYLKTDDYQNTLLYYEKALQVRKTIGYTKGIGQSYNNIGELYITQRLYDSALTNLTTALDVKRGGGDNNSLAVTLANLGKVFLELNNPKKAKPYLVEALSIKRSSGERAGIVTTLNSLGKLNLLQKNYSQAELYLDEAEQLARVSGAPDLLRENLALKVATYKATNRFHESLLTAEELSILKDSLLNKDKMESLLSMQTRYETEKKEQHIQLLQQEKAMQQTALQGKQIWIRSLAIICILIALLASALFYNYRLSQRNKQRVETLLKELHHRVKNNLQILSSVLTLQSQRLTDAAALQAVKSSEGRVNAMALIHKKLYTGEQSLDINLKEYITELIQYLIQSYGYAQKELKLTLDVAEIKLDVDKAIPIGLIINELVTNAFKYAYNNQASPELNVNLTLSNKQNLMLEISDNGQGMPKNRPSDQSFGLKMVDILLQELRGKLNIESKKGTGYFFQIPI